MNRRSFIGAIGGVAGLTTAALACPKCEQGAPVPHPKTNWPYIVYCYEREQGEWVFSENVRGSFAPEREYMTVEDDNTSAYCGWTDNGKLHFEKLDDATDFIHMHIRAKTDINLADSIYDVYYKTDEGFEVQVAHYWFNGDTGNQIQWQTDQQTNWSKVDLS